MPDLLLAVIGLASLAASAMYSVWLFRDATLRQRIAIALFPMSQIAMGAFLFVVIDAVSLGTFAAFVVCAVCLACSAASVALFKAVRSALRQQLDEERATLLAEQLDAQKAYAERLSVEARQASAVRKRLVDDLASIESALADSCGSVKRQVDQASETLRAPQRSFCRNRVIDALMSEKSRQCAESGIDLSCSLDVRDDLPFSPVDLCALFANVMDNAIKASSECDSGDRRIEVRAGEAAGLFVLDVENTFVDFDEPTRVRRRDCALPEHGWGRAILEDIASRNDGTVDVSQDDGVYCLAVTLALSSQ